MCWIKIACALLFSSMCSMEKLLCRHTDSKLLISNLCASTSDWSHCSYLGLIHAASLRGFGRTDGRCGRERKESCGWRRICPPLPLAANTWNTAYITITSAHLLYGFVPLLPLSAHKRIKELRFYVHSQDSWKWWLNLWWPWCVENASLLILYAVVIYMALASCLIGTETFKSLSVWHTACILLSVDNTLFIKHL